MIVFRCLDCYTGHIFNDVLRCPTCFGVRLAPEYLKPLLPRANSPELEHSTYQNKESPEKTTEANIEVLSSPRLHEQSESSAKRLTDSTDDFAHKSARTNNECQRTENVTTIASRDSNQGQLFQNANQDNLLMNTQSTYIWNAYSVNKQNSDTCNPTSSNNLSDSFSTEKVELQQLVTARPISSLIRFDQKFESEKFEKSKNHETSRNDDEDGKLDFAGSSDFSTHKLTLKTYPDSMTRTEDGVGKNKRLFENPSNYPLNKHENSRIGNSPSIHKEHGNKAFHLIASSSKQNTPQSTKNSTVTPLKKERKRRTCRKCNRAFYSESALNMHVQKNCAVKPFECDRCPAAFAVEGHFKKHYMIHTGERPFQCDQCDYSYRHKNDLQKHIERCHRK